MALDDFGFYGLTDGGADAMTMAGLSCSSARFAPAITSRSARWAHSASLRSDFGGFLPAGSVIVNDPALLRRASMHEKQFYSLGPGGFHRIAYTEWGQASAQPPVICVHGLTRNGRDFDYLARTLEGDGRQVFCPDIVGRGKSDWLANPAYYNYPQYLTDMTALIARTGTESVDWVGTSMGGLIGMLLATQANTPVRRLVINDVGPFLPLIALKRIGAYVGQSPVFNDLEGVEKYM